MSFSSSANSQYFFAKISGICPDLDLSMQRALKMLYGCQAVQWAEKRGKNKEMQFFLLFLSLRWTAWPPYRLSHIIALCINFFYLPKDQSLFCFLFFCFWLLGFLKTMYIYFCFFSMKVTMAFLWGSVYFFIQTNMHMTLNAVLFKWYSERRYSGMKMCAVFP